MGLGEGLVGAARIVLVEVAIAAPGRPDEGLAGRGPVRPLAPRGGVRRHRAGRLGRALAAVVVHEVEEVVLEPPVVARVHAGGDHLLRGEEVAAREVPAVDLGVVELPVDQVAHVEDLAGPVEDDPVVAVPVERAQLDVPDVLPAHRVHGALGTHGLGAEPAALREHASRGPIGGPAVDGSRRHRGHGQLLARGDHPADADEVPVDVEVHDRAAVEEPLAAGVELLEHGLPEVGAGLVVRLPQHGAGLRGRDLEEAPVPREERLQYRLGRSPLPLDDVGGRALPGDEPLGIDGRPPARVLGRSLAVAPPRVVGVAPGGRRHGLLRLAEHRQRHVQIGVEVARGLRGRGRCDRRRQLLRHARRRRQAQALEDRARIVRHRELGRGGEAVHVAVEEREGRVRVRSLVGLHRLHQRGQRRHVTATGGLDLRPQVRTAHRDRHQEDRPAHDARSLRHVHGAVTSPRSVLVPRPRPSAPSLQPPGPWLFAGPTLLHVHR